MGNVKHVHFTNTGTAGQTECFNQISRHRFLVDTLDGDSSV